MAQQTRRRHPKLEVRAEAPHERGISVLYQQEIARIVPDEDGSLSMVEAAFVEVARHSAGVDLGKAPGVYTVPLDNGNGDSLTVTVEFESDEPRYAQMSEAQLVELGKRLHAMAQAKRRDRLDETS